MKAAGGPNRVNSRHLEKSYLESVPRFIYIFDKKIIKLLIDTEWNTVVKSRFRPELLCDHLSS